MAKALISRPYIFSSKTSSLLFLSSSCNNGNKTEFPILSVVNDAGSIDPLRLASMEKKIKEHLNAESVTVKDGYGDGRHVSGGVRSVKLEAMALCRARLTSSTFCYRLLRPSIINNNISSNSSYRYQSTAANPSKPNETVHEKIMRHMAHHDINSQIGSCMPLSCMRIGTIIHNIEVNPGRGGKLVRAAGTSAKILKEPTSRYCLIRMPSGDEKMIDTRCRATIGTVSNPSHGAKKLRKAGHSRWLGRRPVVRGVAMNPHDHPHGGGEGRSKSSGNHGKCSLTPWGKPCKSGYKSVAVKKKKKLAVKMKKKLAVR